MYHGSSRLVVLVAIVYLAALASSWMPRLYNRLVAVRNQAEKAWASIEVQLQRRHDLIENLVAVVKKYAAYEGDTLTAITSTRGLPTDEQMHAANAQDSAQRVHEARLLALAESTPALKADAAFTPLSDTLRGTENRIASARQFYNDAVTVLRDRRGTFPYVCIAWLVPIPSFALFGNHREPLGVAISVD